MSLLPRFREHLSGLDLPRGRALVAVSGGPDSVALLDLLDRTRDIHGWELITAHVDHGIDPASAEVASAVAELSARLGLRFESLTLALGPGATETEARAARYAALERIRHALGAGAVVTAHHADDQAETVLMRVLRGSGPAGLAAIAARSGPLFRPLLPFRRHELAAYLVERGLGARLDPANADARHLRSWIRHALLPQVEARLPDVHQRLLALGAQARRNRSAWDAVLESLPELGVTREDDGISVAAPVLATYDSALGAELAIALARRAGCTIGARRAERLLSLASGGSSGDSVPLGEGWRGELAFGRLRVVRADAETPPPLELGDSGRTDWGRWRFTLRAAPAPPVQERSALTAWFPAAALTVRAPRAGDRILPIGGTGRRLVVRCFQDARVPRARRGSWPVLESAGVTLWIPGVCRAGALVPPAGSEALRVDVAYE